MNAPQRAGSARRPYRRPMGAWWQRDPFFKRYMWREVTAVAVAVYALLLLAGVVCLSRGEAAWNAWVQVLRSPWSVGLHAVLVVAMVFHTYTWFEVMPKTMPMLFMGERRVPPSLIVRTGLVAAVLASVVVAWWMWRVAA